MPTLSHLIKGFVTSIIGLPWEDQCEWYILTINRIMEPACAAVCDSINTQNTHTNTHTHTLSLIPLGRINAIGIE